MTPEKLGQYIQNAIDNLAKAPVGTRVIPWEFQRIVTTYTKTADGNWRHNDGTILTGPELAEKHSAALAAGYPRPLGSSSQTSGGEKRCG